MFKLKVNYINCESVYEFETEEERQKDLNNLIWVWELEKQSETFYKRPVGGYVEVI